jgi:hypothetical protein
MKLSSLSILTLAFILSCNQKEVMPDCGCEGKSYTELNNVKAAFVGSSFAYKLSESDTLIRSVRLCESVLVDRNWQPDETLFNFTISGQIKYPCIPPGTMTLVAPMPIFLPTQIIKE